MSHKQAEMSEHRELILHRPRKGRETRPEKVKVFRARVQAALRACAPEDRAETETRDLERSEKQTQIRSQGILEEP